MDKIWKQIRMVTVFLQWMTRVTKAKGSEKVCTLHRCWSSHVQMTMGVIRGRYKITRYRRSNDWSVQGISGGDCSLYLSKSKREFKRLTGGRNKYFAHCIGDKVDRNASHLAGR